MGLGKTVQTAAFLQWLKQVHSIPGPFLIVVPLSTVENWKRELESWTDMNVVVFHGNATSIQVIRDYEWSYPKKPGMICTVFCVLGTCAGGGGGLAQGLGVVCLWRCLLASRHCSF